MASSITNGLFAGRAGIQSHGTAISVLADNIANSNTVGFKQSRPDFVDLLAGNLSGQGSSSVTIGSGSEIKKVTEIFSQGTFEFTGRGLDLGIDGAGFFVVETGGTRLFSRAGNFNVDSDGNLRNQNGYQVLGFPANGAGGLEALNVNSVSQSSVETHNVTLSLNVDASTELTPSASLPTNGDTFAQISDESEFSTTVGVYDSLGASHNVSFYFFHTASNEWTVQAWTDSSEVSTPVQTTPVLLDTFTVQFTSAGARSTAITGSDLQLNATWATGAAVSSIDVEFNPITQFATQSNVASITQDGSGTGSVVSFQVESDGTLFALLDNGQTASIGSIALATFANPEGLRRIGGSLYVNSSTSGEAVIGTPETGQFGAIQAGALEISSADIATDFVRLISLQRGFQGSARIITSINDLLSEVISLAR